MHYLVVVTAASQVLLVVLTSRKAAARCGTPRVCEACRDGEALGNLDGAKKGVRPRAEHNVPGKFKSSRKVKMFPENGNLTGRGEKMFRRRTGSPLSVSLGAVVVDDGLGRLLVDAHSGCCKGEKTSED